MVGQRGKAQRINTNKYARVEDLDGKRKEKKRGGGKWKKLARDNEYVDE